LQQQHYSEMAWTVSFDSLHGNSASASASWSLSALRFIDLKKQLNYLSVMSKEGVASILNLMTILDAILEIRPFQRSDYD